MTPLWQTPLPYMMGMVFLWIIGAMVLVLAPGARENVGRGLWWVALGWPFTIPLGVLIAYLEWVWECRQDRMHSAHDGARRTRIPSPIPARWE
jgi:hypothetical protein